MRVTDAPREQGATAVMLALLMVVLLALAAFTVDYGAYSVQQRRVQNAADASALAIAQECAVGGPGCTSTMSASSGAPYVTQNADASASGTIASLTGSDVEVEVDKPVSMTFARLGQLLADADDDPTATARAKASWNNIPSQVEGEKFLPLGVNVCTYTRMFSSPNAFPSNARIIEGGGLLNLLGDLLVPTSGVNCTHPTGGTYTNQLDRFVWLTGIGGLVDLVDVSACNYRTRPLTTNFVVTAVNDLLAPALGCRGAVSRLRVGDEVVLPIFESRGLLNGVRIVGFAAFEITGWKFGALAGGNSASPPCTGFANLLKTCIRGRFVRDTDDSAAIAYTKPGGLALDLGLLKIRIEDLPL